MSDTPKHVDGLLSPVESLNLFTEKIRTIPYKKMVINTINMILAIAEQDSRKLPYNAVELKLALERLDVLDCSVIYIRPSDYQLRVLFIGYEGPECEEEEK